MLKDFKLKAWFNKITGSVKARRLAAAAVWLVIWQAACELTGLELVLAGPVNVFLSLLKLLGQREFYISAGGSLFHITAGFLAAFAAGCAAGAAAGRYGVIKDFLAPAVVLMQSLPMASFIIILLIWFGSENVAAYISFIVVFPMIYNGVIAGVANIDKKLSEMARVFEIPRLRRLRCIYLAQVAPYVEGNLRSALGMCWKAGVSAEVIGLVSNSVGEQLYYSKLYLMTADLFAWSLAVVVMSFAFEKLFIKLAGFAAERIRRL